MDDIERKLFHDLGDEKEIPNKVRTVIEESIKDTKINKKKYSFIKVTLTTCACLIIAIGIVYAGDKTYNLIWKEQKTEPEKVAEVFENEDIIGKKEPEGINDEEEQKKDGNFILNNIVSEEEAKKRARKILEEYGFEDEKIKSIELENNIQNNKTIWKVETENNIFIEFDAKSGELLKIKCD